MSPQRSTRLRRRLAATLVAVVLADLVFVGALLGAIAPLVETLRTALAPAIPATLWWLVLVSVALLALVAVQLRTARTMTLSRTDVRRLSESEAPALFERVRRLATLADCQPPAIGLVDSDVPNCFSVGGRDPMLVVSSGLRDQLNDDELDAVLAHELAHLRNRDATVMTLATFLPTLATDRPVAGLPRWLRANLFGGAILFAFVVALGWTQSASPTAIGLVAALSLVLGGIALGVLATPVVYLSHRLSQDREFVADRAGATLSGKPEALASALEKLDDSVGSTPQQDLRSLDGVVDELCLLPHGFVRDAAEGDGGRFTIRLRSHPPTSERIDRLREFAAEIES
ncbi:M48 family metalloprotease [Halapricum salinum]|uniref:M48 family metalloprotease n=1 Tax=Halapricum salinum TaxID=1457250 RepID=UPI000678D8E1|nr:M48 family metalloprotease [Halapricum salinum]